MAITQWGSALLVRQIKIKRIGNDE
jgi:hypothetical protein